MKRSLNILTVLILLVLCYSVFEYVSVVGSAFIDGFNAGYESVEEAGKNNTDIKGAHMKAIALTPHTYGAYTDSIYNEVTDSYMPAHFFKVAIEVDNEVGVGLTVLKNICAIAATIAQFLAIIWFIKLIIAINRGVIFSWINVKRLRKLGIVLIVSFILSAIPHIIGLYNIHEYFSLSGYTINQTAFITTTNLILGLVSLIVAQVFAMGLRLQEEQELTI